MGTTKPPTTAKIKVDVGPREPWEQQPEETAVAYQAFKTYRDLDPHQRGLASVASTLGKSTALMSRWSRTNSWVLRASAWDAEQERLWLKEVAVQRRKAAKRNLSTAALAMSKAAQKIIAVSAEELTVADAAKLMDTASKIERLALGESTENVRVSGHGADGAIDVVIGHMTDEERAMRLEQLRRELNARGPIGYDDEGADVPVEV